jgi:hypothetical protein
VNQKMLNAINNQCTIVQKSIAKNFESPKDEELISELQILQALLKEFFSD